MASSSARPTQQPRLRDPLDDFLDSSDLCRVVLSKLSPEERTMLRGVNRGFREAVDVSGLGRTGGPGDVPLKTVNFLDTVARIAWAKDNGSSWDYKILLHLTHRAAECNGDVLKFVIKNIWEGSDYDTKWVCRRLANDGRLDLLKWCVDNGSSLCRMTYMYAASNGDIEMLKYLQQQGCPMNSGAVNMAVLTGRVDVLHYILEHGCECDEDTMRHAVSHNSLETIKYLRAQGCPWGGWRTCKQAHKEGKMEILRFLHESGCPDNPSRYHEASSDEEEEEEDAYDDFEDFDDDWDGER